MMLNYTDSGKLLQQDLHEGVCHEDRSALPPHSPPVSKQFLAKPTVSSSGILGEGRGEIDFLCILSNHVANRGGSIALLVAKDYSD